MGGGGGASGHSRKRGTGAGRTGYRGRRGRKNTDIFGRIIKGVSCLKGGKMKNQNQKEGPLAGKKRARKTESWLVIKGKKELKTKSIRGQYKKSCELRAGWEIQIVFLRQKEEVYGNLKKGSIKIHHCLTTLAASLHREKGRDAHFNWGKGISMEKHS